MGCTTQRAHLRGCRAWEWRVRKQMVRCTRCEVSGIRGTGKQDHQCSVQVVDQLQYRLSVSLPSEALREEIVRAQREIGNKHKPKLEALEIALQEVITNSQADLRGTEATHRDDSWLALESLESAIRN